MAKAPSAPRPCTLVPAGWPRALQPIDVFKCVLLACAVESRGVQRGTVAREPPKRSQSESAIELYVRCILQYLARSSDKYF